uniref:Uncharacterized protein n=1 Tax=Rhizophora mucronata TaxID=61149 RepID=A0A2P2NPX3_RHIMU
MKSNDLVVFFQGICYHFDLGTKQRTS